ncbi:hypothetical protein FAGKG844_60118 [Frankia sp. AgKG'84/4]
MAPSGSPVRAMFRLAPRGRPPGRPPAGAPVLTGCVPGPERGRAQWGNLRLRRVVVVGMRQSARRAGSLL